MTRKKSLKSEWDYRMHTMKSLNKVVFTSKEISCIYNVGYFYYLKKKICLYLDFLLFLINVMTHKKHQLSAVKQKLLILITVPMFTFKILIIRTFTYSISISQYLIILQCSAMALFPFGFTSKYSCQFLSFLLLFLEKSENQHLVLHTKITFHKKKVQGFNN